MTEVFSSINRRQQAHSLLEVHTSELVDSNRLVWTERFIIVDLCTDHWGIGSSDKVSTPHLIISLNYREHVVDKISAEIRFLHEDIGNSASWGFRCHVIRVRWVVERKFWSTQVKDFKNFSDFMVDLYINPVMISKLTMTKLAMPLIHFFASD